MDTVKIEIPKKLKDKLTPDNDDNYSGHISRLISHVVPYYQESPPYFPQYTQHGIPHVNKVLEYADKLIPDNTLNEMNARSTAVLIASVLVHDIGMFIDCDGFVKLISGEYSNQKTNDKQDTETWEEAWQNYLHRVRRFSDKELIECFGSEQPVTEPPYDKDFQTGHDKLIIGEFLRQYHPRLAEHIVMQGMPGTADRSVFDGTGFSKDELMIISITARSHGMSIRATEPCINDRFGRFSTPINVPVYFLMAVLRIADYLDAGDRRAPQALIDRQTLTVRASQAEWNWNQTIRAKDYVWNDTEKCLSIQAGPESGPQFRQVERWLTDIQRELDTSWAVILEKYQTSRSLSIHRLKSNILESESRQGFERKYVVREARLQANPEMLKLLIQPLYGNDPSYGVRELLQNAVDACLERKKWEEAHGNTSYRPQVRVDVDTQKKTFTITDNGIGMNEDILLNYYLSAGSSYRFSDSWKKDFTDDNGKSLVVRTGHFGVGVLASFLLGDHVHVSTRRVGEDTGYVFSFGMECTPLDIHREKRTIDPTVISDGEYGTTVVVNMNNDVDTWKSNTGWQKWFAFRSPEVRYFVDDDEFNPADKRRYVPTQEDNLPGWFSVEDEHVGRIYWSYSEVQPGFQVPLYCNGIPISPGTYPPLDSEVPFKVARPLIALVDANSYLKTDLSRNRVESYPDNRLLRKEIMKYHFAVLLQLDMSHFDTSSILSNVNNVLDNILLSSKGYHFFTAVTLGYVDPKITAVVPYKIKMDEYADIIQERYTMFSRLRRNEFIAIHSDDCSLCTWNGDISHQNQIAISGDFETTNHGAIAAIQPITRERSQDSIFVEIMNDYFREADDVWIPYDPEERKKKFPKAFRELQPYMEDYGKLMSELYNN